MTPAPKPPKKRPQFGKRRHTPKPSLEEQQRRVKAWLDFINPHGKKAS